MKARIPYFDFYPVDFMNGVRGLSAQEVGVYTMVLCRVYEENGPIEFNTMRLSTYCGMREATFKRVVEKLIALGKFDLSDGMLSNHRAETEIQSRADKLKLNSKAGKASAKKRQQNQRSEPTSVQRPFNHTDTDTDSIKSSPPPMREREARPARQELTGTQDDFDRFIAAYPHRVQLPSARGAFQFACLKATPDEIIAGAIRYANKTDDRPWMNPAKWLAEECWNDQPAKPIPKQNRPRPQTRRDEAIEDFLRNDDANENGRQSENDAGGYVLELPSKFGS